MTALDGCRSVAPPFEHPLWGRSKTSLVTFQNEPWMQKPRLLIIARTSTGKVRDSFKKGPLGNYFITMQSGLK